MYMPYRIYTLCIYIYIYTHIYMPIISLLFPLLVYCLPSWIRPLFTYATTLALLVRRLMEVSFALTFSRERGLFLSGLWVCMGSGPLGLHGLEARTWAGDFKVQLCDPFAYEYPGHKIKFTFSVYMSSHICESLCHNFGHYPHHCH